MSEPEDWVLIVLGAPAAIADAKAAFAGSDWKFTSWRENTFLSAPEFKGLDSAKAVSAAGVVLLRAINLARSIVAPTAEPLTVGGAAEPLGDGEFRRHLSIEAETGHYRMRGMPADLVVSGPGRPAAPSREPFALRIAKAVRADPAIETAAAALSERPLSWAALYVAFETINALTSPDKKRASQDHYEGLGWAQSSEPERFRRTSNYHRHGLPRHPLPPTPMSLQHAEEFIRGLFDRLIDSRT